MIRGSAAVGSYSLLHPGKHKGARDQRYIRVFVKIQAERVINHIVINIDIIENIS